uniref:Uncharacterized protein n=1 Tax=Eutreptiella gymnastica TaxID=73025 RepID=A0A7S4FWC1_9EUGL
MAFCHMPHCTATEKQQFRGFEGAHGPGYMGLAATMWVPTVLEYRYCHQRITQAHPRSDRRVSEEVEFPENLQVPPNFRNNSTFGAFEGPMARDLQRAASDSVGPSSC